MIFPVDTFFFQTKFRSTPIDYSIIYLILIRYIDYSRSSNEKIQEIQNSSKILTPNRKIR